jgi:polygalacturonase
MLVLMLVLMLVHLLTMAGTAQAARFNIGDYGATADDQTDDTLAIRRALAACEVAGGGVVYVPAGTYLVSRQASESPILELPSNTTLHGDGAASVLKFDPQVNRTNFWRMLGAGPEGCRHVTVRDLRLDGSNTFQSYEPGKTPEHNHGLFFHCADGVIENVCVRDCLIENFSGDCVALSVGCRNVTVRDVSLRNFVRQGIQMGGGNGAAGYLVTGCQDLEGDVLPGGSTIHVEHARGLRDVIITANRCRHSILAGGVDGLVIRDNTVTGRLVGNGNSNVSVQGNIVRGGDTAGFVVQLGYADGLILRDNVVTGGHAEAGGVYVWGASRYNPEPSRDVLIGGNVIRVGGRGLLLSGVDGGQVRGNLIQSGDPARLTLQRTQRVETDDQP